MASMLGEGFLAKAARFLETPMTQPHAIAQMLGSKPSLGTLSVFGPRVRILTEYGENDDEPCLIYGEMDPGVFVPLHSHPDGENWYVVQGVVRFFREGAGWAEMNAGSSCRAVEGVRHALVNHTGQVVVMLLATTAKMARFFRAIGTPVEAAPAGPPSPQALVRLLEAANDFGYWLGDSSDNAAIGLRID